MSPHPSRAVSRNAYGMSNDLRGFSDVQFTHNDVDPVGVLHSAASPGLVRVQSLGSTMSQSFASAVVSSLSRSTTPDPHAEKKMVSNGFGAAASHVTDCGDIAVALFGLGLSSNQKNHLQDQLYHEFDQSEGLYNMRNDHSKYLQQNITVKPEPESLHVPGMPLLAHNGFSKSTGGLNDLGLSALPSNGQIGLRAQSSPMSLSKKASVLGSNSLAGSSGHYLSDMANIDFSGHNPNTFQTLPGMLNNQLDEGILSINS